MKPDVLERNLELLFARSYRARTASRELRERIAATFQREIGAVRPSHPSVAARRSVATRPAGATSRAGASIATRPPVARRWSLAAAAGIAALSAAIAWSVWRANGERTPGQTELASDRPSYRASPDGAWRELDEREAREGLDAVARWIEIDVPGRAGAEARVWLGSAGRVDLAAATRVRIDGRDAPASLSVELERGALELERYAAGGAWRVTTEHGPFALDHGAMHVAAARVDATSGATSIEGPDAACARLSSGVGTAGAGERAVALSLDRDVCLARGSVLAALADAAPSGSSRAVAIGSPPVAPPAPPVEPARPEEKRASFRGVIESEGEMPKNVTVTLLRHVRLPNVSLPRKRECAVTDGRFECGDIAPGSYRVCVTAPGHALWQIPEIELAARAMPADGTPAEPQRLTVRLERGGAIRGRVLDPDGKPIGGAIVLSEQDTPVQILEFALDAIDPSWPASARTRDDGSYELAHVGYGSHVLRATRASFAAGWSERVDLRRGEPVPDVDVALSPSGSIHGHVSRDDGMPWPGAEIIASVMDMSLQRPLMSYGAARADATGAYRIDGLPRGGYVVLNASSATSGGAPTTPLVSSVSLARGASVLFDLPGSALGARVAGRLVDASGAPVAGYDVSLYDQARADGSGWLAARSGADGSFEFARVVPGRYEMLVGGNLGQHFVQQTIVDVPAVPEFRLDWTLSENVLDFVVLDAETSAPIAGSAVILQRLDPSGYTFAGKHVPDASGSARFAFVPDGVYRVVAYAFEGRYAPEPSIERTLGPGSRHASLEIRLRRGAGLDVLVVDERGRRVAHASVQFADADGGLMQFSADDRTDSNGRLHVQGIAAGTWTITVAGIAGRDPVRSIVRLEVGEVREITIALAKQKESDR